MGGTLKVCEEQLKELDLEHSVDRNHFALVTDIL